MRVRFGDCLLDTDTRELFRKEKAVHLPPTAFRLLELLVESRPKALSKDQILEKVWPGIFISEATLASAISDIRITIGDTEEARFIRTVHGYGYAFSGATNEAATTARPVEPGVEWRLIWDDREVALTQGDNILGRDHGAAVWIDSESVSRAHARITVSGEKAAVEDLGSKNGTFISGKRIQNGPYSLSDGDEFCLGSVRLTIRCLPTERSTATA